MRRLILLTLYLLLGARLPLVGQGELIVMSYNVENLFDLEDHPERADDEFLPMGSHRWTKARYERKLHQIAEVLSSAGSLTHFPDLVALVEVENAGVLRDLLSHTPLGAQAGYAFTVTEGEDPRGINVALLYRTETFRPTLPLRQYEADTSHPRGLGARPYGGYPLSLRLPPTLPPWRCSAE